MYPLCPIGRSAFLSWRARRYPQGEDGADAPTQQSDADTLTGFGRRTWPIMNVFTLTCTAALPPRDTIFARFQHF
jgi:hypothetical protein